MATANASPRYDSLIITVYKDRTGKNWRWKIQAPNRRKIGASTEGYRSRGMCLANLAAVTGILLDRQTYPRGAVTVRVKALARSYTPGEQE